MTILFNNAKKGASEKATTNMVTEPYCETITKIRRYHNNQNIWKKEAVNKLSFAIAKAVFLSSTDTGQCTREKE